jgi:hypothetical protein
VPPLQLDASSLNGQVIMDDVDMDDENGHQITLKEEYIPLLNNWSQLLPGYRIRKANEAADQPELGAAARRRILRRDRNKSPSPAGVKPTIGAKAAAAAAAAKTTGKDRSTAGQPPTNRKHDKRTSIAVV